MEESDMSFQIYNWLEKYVHEVVSTFGYRIWFIGVQGSYASCLLYTSDAADE